jgi:lysosomal acid lipase/cholesteryl ester hydrolase
MLRLLQGAVLSSLLVAAAALRHDLSTIEMIVEAGYPAEKHEVTTEDCYINTLHRIPGEGKVVFLQHGLIDSSATWVIAGPEHGGLAFRLAEAGYDVWLGNFRGNTYSRKHCTMNPDNDQAYWHFTWDEMAKYDLPTSLDYVLKTTGKEKMFYVGHSMGSTTYLVMNSLNQTWADRVELATFFAPVAYVDHMTSPIAWIAPFSGFVDWIAEHMGLGEFIPSNWFMDIVASLFCSDGSWLEGVCENVVFLLCGYDSKQMNETMLETIVQHLPAGASTYTILHYAQEVNSKEFMGFDWGEEMNQVHHGQSTPPLYHLEDVNTQIALFWGDGDWLVEPGDLLKIISGVQNIYRDYQVPWEGWNHLDFMYAIDVDKFINEPFIDMINNF